MLVVTNLGVQGRAACVYVPEDSSRQRATRCCCAALRRNFRREHKLLPMPAPP